MNEFKIKEFKKIRHLYTQPLWPQYQSLNHRIASFRENSISLKLTNDVAERLSEAGFYYLNDSNYTDKQRVCCFSCGGCVEVNELGNCENFLTAHTYYFPECEFIRSRKTEFKDFKRVDTYLKEIYDIIKKRKNKKLNENNRQNEDDDNKLVGRRINDCVICLSREKKIIFLPCSHYSCCDSCSVNVTHCPICRHLICDKKIVYNS